MAKIDRITVSSETDEPLKDAKKAWIRKTIRTVLRAEGVTVPCEINVLLTDDKGIKKLNRTMRGINKATDVLSFPMFDYKPGRPPKSLKNADDATGLTPLGDMAISMEHVRAQAKEYGHSEKRELSYLAVHSALHLLGYDHMDEGRMKKQMRRREEAILAVLGVGEP
ncbi:MAG: rRNA maturation RNase YbeY [Oscillospiraceae bacterium]|nr:rRNA maturation RNase YbeY [Oscillospiraceae bacterium]